MIEDLRKQQMELVRRRAAEGKRRRRKRILILTPLLMLLLLAALLAVQILGNRHFETSSYHLRSENNLCRPEEIFINFYYYFTSFLIFSYFIHSGACPFYCHAYFGKCCFYEFPDCTSFICRNHIVIRFILL